MRRKFRIWAFFRGEPAFLGGTFHFSIVGFFRVIAGIEFFLHLAVRGLRWFPSGEECGSGAFFNNSLARVVRFIVIDLDFGRHIRDLFLLFWLGFGFIKVVNDLYFLVSWLRFEVDLVLLSNRVGYILVLVFRNRFRHLLGDLVPVWDVLRTFDISVLSELQIGNWLVDDFGIFISINRGVELFLQKFLSLIFLWEILRVFFLERGLRLDDIFFLRVILLSRCAEVNIPVLLEVDYEKDVEKKIRESLTEC